MSEQNTRKTYSGGDVSEKIFNTRIVHKHDTEANWNKATNFIPKAGELIVYDADENYNYTRTKVGDGISNINALPFSHQAAVIASTEAPEDTTAVWVDLDDNTFDKNIEYASFITPQMFGAKADGVTDDTKAIQDALDYSSFIYIPDGVYMINGSNGGWSEVTNGGIYPRSGQRIILSNNAKLKAITNENGFYNIVNIKEVHDVHIIGGIIEGDNATHTGTSGDQAYGISIRAASNIIIENMEIYNCWSDSIIIGYNQGIDSSNIKILNCILHDNKRQGISIVGCDTALINGCKIYNISGKNPKAGIDVEPDGTTAKANNITINCCHIYNTDSASIIVSGNTPTNVKITNNSIDGLNITEGEDILIDNCRISSLYGAAQTNIFVSNSNLSKVIFSGSSIYFNNCNFQNRNADVIILASLDHYPDRISELISFNHCYFKTVSDATRFMLLNGYDTEPYYSDKNIEFISCEIDLQNGASFSNRMPGKELKLTNCKIIIKDNAYQAFTINNIIPTRFIMQNNKVICSTTMNYLFSTNANVAHYIDFNNNEFSNFIQMLYCDNGATGTIRLLNNTMSNTKIIGTNTFEVISQNVETWTFTLADDTIVTKKVVLM